MFMPVHKYSEWKKGQVGGKRIKQERHLCHQGRYNPQGKDMLAMLKAYSQAA